MSRSVAKFVAEYATLPVVLLASLFFRVALLLYGEWQDEHFAVKFTDVDYHVFSDASRHVSEGNSPFLRRTYRYTPLLALLLVPNHLLFFAFGKLLFVLCDLLAGWLIYEILSLKRVKDTTRLVSVAVWLLNPLTAAVSARGNAESFLAVLVLSSLFFLLRKQVTLSAIAYGTAVHVKIFPAIYSLPIFLFLDDNYTTSEQPAQSTSHDTHRPSSNPPLSTLVTRFLNVHRVRFTLITTAVFCTLTGVFYAL